MTDSIRSVRWGILGCGSMASQFALGLRQAPGAVLVAVGSRDAAKAEAFRSAHGGLRAYGSYQALAADPEIEVVYVATPHVTHCEHTLLCLGAGKAVLCEKPFAINAKEARHMVQAARQAGLFLMEAMWTRCFPVMERLRQWIAAGRIGEPRMVQADFGFRAAWNPQGRLLNPALGGGSLLDVGIYTVSFASMVLGRPVAATGFAHLGETGVDEQAAMILRHPAGALSVLSSSVRVSTPHEAQVWGTEGRIRVGAPFWKPSMLVYSGQGQEERVEMPFEGNGYQFEAIEVARCLGAGQLESQLIPQDETVALMETLDSLRAQWGLRYPGE